MKKKKKVAHSMHMFLSQSAVQLSMYTDYLLVTARLTITDTQNITILAL